MTTGTFTADLTAALAGQARQLAHLRHISIAEAWSWVAQTCRQNIDQSQGDRDGTAYWRAALAIAQKSALETERDPRWTP